MKAVGELLIGLLMAAGSMVFVTAAVALALAEGNIAPSFQMTPSAVVTPTLLIDQAPFVTPSIAAANTPTPETFCAVPEDWEPYAVASTDTLASLAQETGLTVDEILKANCLLSDTLLPNTILYLPHQQMAPTDQVPPALPTAPLESTLISCAPPTNWVLYTVQSGENLYRLSQSLGVTLKDLQTANCLHSSTIYTGQELYVPMILTNTPESVRSPTTAATAAFTSTNTAAPPNTLLSLTSRPPEPSGTPSATQVK
jgi:LysM repeat protein